MCTIGCTLKYSSILYGNEDMLSVSKAPILDHWYYTEISLQNNFLQWTQLLKLYYILFMFFIFNVAHGYYDCLFSQPPVNHWSSYQFATVHLKITVLQCNVKAWNKLVCSAFTLLYMFYLPLPKVCKKTCIQHSNNCVILRTCTRCTHGYRLTCIETGKNLFRTLLQKMHM